MSRARCIFALFSLCALIFLSVAASAAPPVHPKAALALRAKALSGLKTKAKSSTAKSLIARCDAVAESDSAPTTRPSARRGTEQPE